MFRWRLVAPALLLGFGGCGHDELVGRYKSATCETIAWNQPAGLRDDFRLDAAAPAPCRSIVPRAAASAISVATPSAAGGRMLGDLGDRTLAAYVQGALSKGVAPDKLPAQLAAAIKSAPDGQGVDDHTTFKRTLVVSTWLEGGFNPADRLEQTDILIKPSRAIFTEWDALSSTQGNFDAGTIQLTQARGATEALMLGAPAGAPVSGSTSLGGSQTDSRVESVNAKGVVNTQTVWIDEQGNLRIRRRGGYGIDLADNAVIHVKMIYTGDPDSHSPKQENRVFTYRYAVPRYEDDKHRRLPSERVTIVGHPVLRIKPGEDIKADVFLNYTIRHVSAGGDTYEEADDRTLDRTIGPVAHTTTLISAREVAVPGYGIGVGPGNYQVEVRPRGRESSTLCFASANEAQDFIAYMAEAPGPPPLTIGTAEVGVLDVASNPDHPPIAGLTRAQLGNVSVTPDCI